MSRKKNSNQRRNFIFSVSNEITNLLFWGFESLYHKKTAFNNLSSVVQLVSSNFYTSSTIF